MRKRLFKLGLVCVTILSLWGCGNTEQSETKNDVVATRDVFAMDTTMTLTAYGENAEKAVDEAEQEIKRLDALLSTGSSDSEITIVNENGSAYVSEDTAALIQKSLEIHKETKGAFDISVYPLMEAWGFTNHDYHVPTESTISDLLKAVDASRIEFDAESRFVSIPEEMKIDLGGIAKGYTSARIMEIFKENQVTAGMVSLGGNVQLYNTKPDGSLWRVAIENPDGGQQYLGIVSTKDKAVITSGGYERYFEKDGKTYHHIIDPATGYPADSGLKSVTIVSEDGMLADGLSTSLFVMGKEKALDYWKENSEKFDVILEEDNGEITITEGLKDSFTSDFEYDIKEAE